jgi:hypothetical protein
VTKRPAVLIIIVLLLSILVPPVPATTFGPAISQISPTSGPNNGVVTITVTGTGLSTLTIIRLNKCRLKTGGSSEAPFEGTVISKSDTSVTARFNLNGKVAGQYDLSLSAPWNGQEAWAVADSAFTVYQATGSAPVVTSTAIPITTTATTAPTPQGKNGVVFESSPPGATVHLDGVTIGTTPFMYYTDRDGTFNVVFWKDGYADYETKVTIYEGRVVQCAAPLTLKPAVTTATATATATATTAATTAATATPAGTTPATTSPAATARMTTTPVPGNTTVAAATTLPPYTIVVPTPWPTDTPAAQHSPPDPLLAPAAAVLSLALVLLRRR